MVIIRLLLFGAIANNNDMTSLSSSSSPSPPPSKRMCVDGRIAFAPDQCEAFPAEPDLLYARLKYAQQMRQQQLARLSECYNATTTDKFAPLTQEKVDALPAESSERKRIKKALEALPLLTEQFSGWAAFDEQCNSIVVFVDHVPMFSVNQFPWVRLLVEQPSFKAMSDNNAKVRDMIMLTAVDNYLEVVPVYTPLLFAMLHNGRPGQLTQVPLYISSLTLYSFYCRVRAWLLCQDAADVVERELEAQRKAEMAQRGEVEKLQREREREEEDFERQRRGKITDVKQARTAALKMGATIANRLRGMYRDHMTRALSGGDESDDSDSSSSNSNSNSNNNGNKSATRPLTPLSNQTLARLASKRLRRRAINHTVYMIRLLEAQIITLLRLPSTSITALATPAMSIPDLEDVDIDTLDDCELGRFELLSLIRQIACSRKSESLRLTEDELARAPFASPSSYRFGAIVDGAMPIAEAALYIHQCFMTRPTPPSQPTEEPVPENGSVNH